MDIAGIGYTYLFSGIAIFVAISIFLLEVMLHVMERESNRLSQALHIILIVLIIIWLGSLAFFLTETGSLLVNYSKTLDQQNQKISINLSCADSINCTANIPNNLLISCPTQSCPSEKVCPPVIVCPPKKVCLKQMNNTLLAIPKF